jgi:hypothetical protein
MASEGDLEQFRLQQKNGLRETQVTGEKGFGQEVFR